MTKLTKKQQIELCGQYNEMKENRISYSNIARKTNTEVKDVVDFFNR